MTSITIGYSGFDHSEECYEYFENSCYIADTPQAAEKIMRNSYTCVGRYRIDPVTIEQIMVDYGCSCGEFAMEKGAFNRFKVLAEQKNIGFRANEEDCDVPLMIVKVEGVKISDD